MDTLNTEQRQIAERVLGSKEHFFITGSAGTGKSFMLKTLIKLFSEKYMNPNCVVVTALTGVAAVSIGGGTLHSFCGFGYDGTKKPNKFTLDRWCKTNVLIIDEVSMLTAEMFDKMYKYILLYGVQVLCFGDFLQLPPVSGNYCFESKKWGKLKLDKNTIVLKTIVRQQDKQFASILNEIRIGEISNESLEYLKKHDISEADEIKENATKIYATNKNVNGENLRRLGKLETEIYELECKDIVTKNKELVENFVLSEHPIILKMLNKEAPQTIKLKIGAEVILTKNKGDNILVNGSRGTVVDITDGFPKVEFRLVNSEETFTTMVDRHPHELKYKGFVVTRHQYPLKLAWSLTVHKVQGMTLKDVLFNTSGSFETGQIYVGMSRVTDPEGLIVDDIEDLIHLNKVNEKALKYYKDFGTV